MKKSLLILFAAASLASCSNNDQKAGAKKENGNDQTTQMANDVCKCFQPLAGSFSNETKALFKRVSQAPDPQQGMQQELMKLSPEEQTKIMTELSALASLGQESSEINRCLDALKTKYKGMDLGKDTAMAESLARSMEGRADCEMGATLVRLGVKANAAGVSPGGGQGQR